MIVSSRGLNLIQNFEGCARRLPDGRLKAYPDPATGAAPWTIGWGTTGPDVRPGTIWSQAQADARLKTDVTVCAGKVERLLDGAATTQGQFEAMVCLAYNIGLGNFGTSTLLKRHKEGKFEAAQAEFARWNKAAGKVLPGLTKRRAAEAALYGEK